MLNSNYNSGSSKFNSLVHSCCADSIAPKKNVEDESASIFPKTENDTDFEETNIGLDRNDDEYLNGFRKEYTSPDAAENNRKINKSKFFFDYFVPYTKLIDQQINTIQVSNGQGGSDTCKEIISEYETKTTSDEITEEEAKHGVVAKRTEKYPTPGHYILMDTHKDIFEYEDGSVLENYYDNGTDLSQQCEYTYDEGCDPKNPKNGDVQTKLTRYYNDDGSYSESEQRYTYNEELGGWLGECVYVYGNHRNYDADGNLIPFDETAKNKMTFI